MSTAQAITTERQRNECKANKRPNTTQPNKKTDGRKCRQTLAAEAAKGSLSNNDNNAYDNVD